MFNYLFPIFCFGLVITGIVVLGIIEAAKQMKSQETQLALLKLTQADLPPAAPPDLHHPRLTAVSSRE